MNRISVIIPTYQHAATLPRVLGSVFAQTLQPTEVIVVDDGSTDSTVAVLAPYTDRITYVHQQNQGAPMARNPRLPTVHRSVCHFGTRTLWRNTQCLRDSKRF